MNPTYMRHRTMQHVGDGCCVCSTFDDILLLSLKFEGEQMHSSTQIGLLLLKNAFVLLQIPERAEPEIFLCSVWVSLISEYMYIYI